MLVCANDGPSRRVVVLVVAVMERIVCGYGCNVFGYLPLPFDHFFFAFPPAGAIVMCCAVLVVKGGEGEVNVNVDSQVCVRRRQVSRAHQVSLSVFRNASPLGLRVPSTHQLCDSTATTAAATATAVTGKVK